MSNRGSQVTEQAGVVIQGSHDVGQIKTRSKQMHSGPKAGYICISDVVDGGLTFGSIEDPSIARIDPGELVFKK